MFSIEPDFKVIFSGIAVVISFVALIASFISLYYSRQQHKENKALAIEKFIIENSKFYIELYNQEYKKIKKITGDLSILLVQTNTNIGSLFEKYENSYRKDHDISTYLRHIYNDTHELIMKSFKSELSYQSPGNLYWRLAYFKNITLDDENKVNNNIEFGFDIKNGIAILEKSINKNKQQKLYDDFLIEIKPTVEFFQKILPDIKLSIENLENGLDQNKIENFSLQQNYRAYRLYIQLLNFLKLIDKSWIPLLLDYDQEPYLPISKIVYIGANMSILHELISRVSGSYWE